MTNRNPMHAQRDGGRKSELYRSSNRRAPKSYNSSIRTRTINLISRLGLLRSCRWRLKGEVCLCGLRLRVKPSFSSSSSMAGSLPYKEAQISSESSSSHNICSCKSLKGLPNEARDEKYEYRNNMTNMQWNENYLNLVK